MNWIVLFFAIVFEVSGTLTLKFTDGMTRLWPTVAMFAFYLCSLFGLSVAVEKIPVGVAYAVWSGIGTLLVAVVGATATLVLSFVPLAYLPGIAGSFIRSLPMAVIFAVVASLFVSLTIVPWLSSMILPRTEPKEGNRFLQLLEGGIQKTYAPRSTLLRRCSG